MGTRRGGDEVRYAVWMGLGVLAVLNGVVATEMHVVVWGLPSVNNVNYTVLGEMTYTVGDMLHFQYDPVFHNVASLKTLDAFQSCDISNTGAIDVVYDNTGNTVITLNSTGTLYFVCQKATHCSDGQKLMISVTAAPGPSPGTGPGSDSPRSSSLPATAAALALALAAAAASFLLH